MPVDKIVNHPWTRKHDDPRSDLFPHAPVIAYPKDLPELIELCKNRDPGQRYKAAGSHWALSEAAISDHTFIETHDPRNVRRAMGKMLTNVIPRCLNRDYVQRMVDIAGDQKFYLVHVEAGKRIYQLYAELDLPIDVGVTSNLAGYIADQFGDATFGGPWAFETLGGAGGQTVVGALTTGTHGGDFDRPPLADAVVALHLVADGGKHYWIEAVDGNNPPLTDDFMLSLEFRTDALGGPDAFEVIRDNAVFDAVLVSAGRFGVIYSVVLRAVPQYSLYERRRLHLWQDIKEQIKDLSGPLYRDAAILPDGFTPSTAVTSNQRFLQIAVSLTTHANFSRNLVGITKRWQLALPLAPEGRAERVGEILGFSDRLRAPMFARAGANHPYTPHDDLPHQAANPGLIERACADGSFLKGVIQAVIDEIEEFVNTNGAVVGAGIGAMVVIGAGGLLLLIPAFLLILIILRELLDLFEDDTRFGEVMETIKNRLLDPNQPDPLVRAAGLFAWQMIYYLGFQSQQSERDYEAISYAVMDQRDYLNSSCEVNVDSVEVFFSAIDDRLIAFVDALIAFEKRQEFEGKAFVGYASLRFTKRTRALIGMQKFDTACSVEVACLRDVSGSQELVDYAVSLARNPNFGALLHWGQRNDWTREEVERVYGDSLLNPGGNLGFWRQALARITDNGRLDGFSSEFTRRAGLEVVQPRLGRVWLEPDQVGVGQEVTVHWDCRENPPGFWVTLNVVTVSAHVTGTERLPLLGSHRHHIQSASTHAFGVMVHCGEGSGERTEHRYVQVIPQ